MSINEDTLKLWAKEEGFCQCALCGVESFEAQRMITEQQPPLKERRQLRFDPRAEQENANSLAVLLWAYRPAALPDDSCVYVDSYYDASNAAYHAAKRLETRILHAGGYARANVSYPAKTAAVRAGLGIIGRNSLLITKNHGTRVVIILMATDIIPFTQEEERTSECVGCGRCIKACPVGALTEEGMTHPERCLRNYMLEGIPVPQEYRPLMGRTMIGCDICQRACPMQPKMDETSSGTLPLADFITEDSSAFSSAVSRLAERIGRNAARPQRVRAQAAILAGNTGNPTFLPVLDAWVQSDFEAVSKHASWAAARIRANHKSGGST